MGRIQDWWHRPAKWYQFWRPQTGTMGGMITATVILAIIYFTLKTLEGK